MRNAFLLHQKSRETTEITTSWGNTSIHISPSGDWLLTIADSLSSSWFVCPMPFVTVLHIPSSRQQELELKIKDWKSVKKKTEKVDFAQDTKTRLQYAVITFRDSKFYLCLNPEWVEEVAFPQNLLPSLHLEKKVCVPARISKDGNTAAVCHETKIDCLPFAVISHESRVIKSCFLSDHLVFTADTNHVAKLTRIDLSLDLSKTVQYDELQYPEGGNLLYENPGQHS